MHSHTGNNMSKDSHVDKFFSELESALKLVNASRSELRNLQQNSVKQDDAATTDEKTKLLNEVQAVREDNDRLAQQAEARRKENIQMDTERKIALSKVGQLEQKIKQLELENDWMKGREKSSEKERSENADLQTKYDLVVKENKRLVHDLVQEQERSRTAQQFQPTAIGLESADQIAAIAQRYEDLYKIHWRDALTISEEHLRFKKKALQRCIMRELLTNVYVFCKVKSKSQVKEMQHLLTKTPVGSMLPETFWKAFEHSRQLTTNTVLDTLLQSFKAERLPQDQRQFAPKAPEFVKECMRVCWWMVINDPPLTFAPEDEHGDFDKNMYNVYQTGGKKVRYVVWPAMISQDGNIVAKGVAECC